MRSVPEGFVVPNFGPAPAAAAASGRTRTEVAGGGSSGDTGPRKLALICSKGNLDMAYPGLILGNAAASEGVEVHVFFTFWGLDIVNTKTNGNLKFTMVGNTAMHMNELGRIKPGLEHRSMPQIMGRIPGMTKFATWMMKKQIAELDVPDVPDFLDLMQAAGVHMYACRMTFDMMKLIEADMHPGVEGVISATDFIEISENAQTIFI
ncbi:DsrE/DsrF/DrsH-like family protein [Aestuariimicrobium ganziense]|uniref:DsrE/DsrF/DrsH-like family protein n=1 Tax=Aestuariimicrobium ganziense TaxID=2773677 RepID=UPI002E28725A|nr:DsrE/DsrF/DrsH-like family protein [Aestuariimicrobium ganziense]